MTDLAYRFPRFFVTAPGPCPYLPGRTERKIFIELRAPDAIATNDVLSRFGFRRSQTVAYRPSCDACKACVSVRVPVRDFTASASQRRLTRRHADLSIAQREPWTTAEQFALLRHYLSARHAAGGMAAMDALDYADMVEQTPVDTIVVEYRDATGALVGACLTDRQSDGLSMIYSFFNTDVRAGLGTFMILDHIGRAAAAGLAHVYLGYWVEGSERMSYKSRFRPIERLAASGWVRDPLS